MKFYVRKENGFPSKHLIFEMAEVSAYLQDQSSD